MQRGKTFAVLKGIRKERYGGGWQYRPIFLDDKNNEAYVGR